MSCFCWLKLSGCCKNGVIADLSANRATIEPLFDLGTIVKNLSVHWDDFLRMTPVEQTKSIQGIGSNVTPIGEAKPTVFLI